MNIFLFLIQKIFCKKNNIKAITAPKYVANMSDTFNESIKVKLYPEEKIKLRKCMGNGAGISDTIGYKK